jgi:hypothetical protein
MLILGEQGRGVIEALESFPHSIDVHFCLNRSHVQQTHFALQCQMPE